MVSWAGDNLTKNLLQVLSVCMQTCSIPVNVYHKKISMHNMECSSISSLGLPSSVHVLGSLWRYQVDALQSRLFWFD